MRHINLDEFSPWIIYLLGSVALAGFVLALILLIRSFLTTARNPHAAQMFRRTGRQSWFFTFATAIAVWFLGSSMYFRFHGLEVDKQQIVIFYFWPRPPVVIPGTDLVEVKFAPAYRTCGHMEVTTRSARYLSVNFRDCRVFADLRDEFTARMGARWE